MNKEYIVEVHLSEYFHIPVKVMAENNELALSQVQGTICGEWSNFVDMNGNSVRIKSSSVYALICHGL